jgi:hypothetical protein
MRAGKESEIRDLGSTCLLPDLSKLEHEDGWSNRWKRKILISTAGRPE